MRKFLYKFLYLISIACVLYATILLGAFGYLKSQEKKLLTKVHTAFSKISDGNLTIESIHASLVPQFPFFGIVLQDVVLRDKNWRHHQKDIFQAKQVLVQLESLPLLLGKINVKSLNMINGRIQLLTDTTQYSNHDIFIQQQNNNKGLLELKKINFESFEFEFTNPPKNKNISLSIEQLSIRSKQEGHQLTLAAKGMILVRQLGFNLTKGVFLRNKNCDLDLTCIFNAQEKALRFRQQKIAIEGQQLEFDADFWLKAPEPKFFLAVKSPNLNYKKTIEWMSRGIQQPLKNISIEKPFELNIVLEGKLKNQPIPKIALSGQLKNNTVITKFGTFEKTNFQVSYNNSAEHDSLYGDHYAQLKLYRMNAQFRKMNIWADSSIVTNLTAPVINTNLKAQFELTKLNPIIGGKAFTFQQGNAVINMQLKACLALNKDSISDIDGSIDIQNAGFSYLPRKLKFNNSNFSFHFNDQDIILKEGLINTQNSQFRLKAEAKDFFKLYHKSPEQLYFTASLQSEKVDLNEFERFLNKRLNTKTQSTKKSSDLSNIIDKALALSKTAINLQFQNLSYKKFNAENIQAQLTLLPNGIRISNAQLNHAGGISYLNGNLINWPVDKSHFNIQAQTKNVKIDQLLEGFANFGQYTLLPDQIKGQLTMHAHLEGDFDTKNRLVTDSVLGKVHFSFEQGELIQFKPLLRMGKILLKKKRLELVKLQPISNTLYIRGHQITIPNMLIQSDLIDMQLKGVYNLKKGTDLDVHIPMFDKEKEELQHFDPKMHKGYWIYVKAKDDAKGKIKYEWKIQNKEIAEARNERKQRKKAKEQLQTNP